MTLASETRREGTRERKTAMLQHIARPRVGEQRIVTGETNTCPVAAGFYGCVQQEGELMQGKRIWIQKIKIQWRTARCLPGEHLV